MRWKQRGQSPAVRGSHIPCVNWHTWRRGRGAPPHTWVGQSLRQARWKHKSKTRKFFVTMWRYRKTEAERQTNSAFTGICRDPQLLLVWRLSTLEGWVTGMCAYTYTRVAMGKVKLFIVVWLLEEQAFSILRHFVSTSEVKVWTPTTLHG